MEDQAPRPDAELAWTTEIDPPLLERARIDVARALIVQNNRAGRRFDPVGRLRTPENEARALALARKLVVVGLVLSVFLALIQPRSAWFLLLFLVLYVCFRYLEPLRQRAVDALDGVLIRRAGRVLAKVRAPSVSRVAIQGSTIGAESHGLGGQRRTWTRDLGSVRYALVGEVTLILFGDRRGLRPKIVVFLSEEGERERVTALLRARGHEVETLSRDLLSGVLVRRWP